MTIQVNERTIRRGQVALIIPPLDPRWETYRFRTVNREYPAAIIERTTPRGLPQPPAKRGAAGVGNSHH